MASAVSHPDDERARLVQAVAASPRDPALRRALAVNLAKAGEAEAALAHFRALLDVLPDDADAAADAGLMARRCNLEEQMLPLVRSAAASNPGHARVWQVLGLMHRAVDELDPAMNALDRAVGIASRNPLIVHGRARAYLEAGRPAAAYFEQARRLAPDDELILLGLLSALVAEGRVNDAMAKLEETLAQRPDWIAGHSTLARLRWMMGEQDCFTESFEQALRALPASIPLWRELITTLMHASRFEDALDAIERARRYAGPHIGFDANEAVCRAEAGQFEAADRVFAALARFNDPTVTIRHVRHLLRTRRPVEAERIAEPLTRTPSADLIWPYLSIAWRMTNDDRWEWLEGDPRLVGVYDVADALPPLDTLAAVLRPLHATVAQPLEQSVRGGTQTDGTLFSRTEPEIRALRSAIVAAVAEHIAQLPPPDPAHPVLAWRRDRPIRFSGSWSVRLLEGGHHANHIHPEGWISSAFYAVLPDAAERGEPPAGWLVLGEPQAELQLDLPPLRMVEPKPGRLALFPSIMWHGTRPFDAGERMTVAFDVARPR